MASSHIQDDVVERRCSDSSELSLRLVQLDLGDKKEAVHANVDLIGRSAKRHKLTLRDLMQRGIRADTPPTLSQYQSIIADRWGEFDCLRGWSATMDTFEHEMRLCISEEAAEENLVNALMHLSSLATMSSVDMSRGSTAINKKDKGHAHGDKYDKDKASQHHSQSHSASGSGKPPFGSPATSKSSASNYANGFTSPAPSTPWAKGPRTTPSTGGSVSSASSTVTAESPSNASFRDILKRASPPFKMSGQTA